MEWGAGGRDLTLGQYCRLAGIVQFHDLFRRVCRNGGNFDVLVDNFQTFNETPAARIGVLELGL